MLSKETFLTAIESLPLVSVDLIIQNSEGKYLLGLRSNRPAQGFWFVPGGRILKNEKKEDALARILLKELGVKELSSEVVFYGAYQHFYQDCFEGDIGISTHYVVLAHNLTVHADAVSIADNQHSEMRWWSKEELLSSAQVHQYTKDYFINC